VICDEIKKLHENFVMDQRISCSRRCRSYWFEEEYGVYLIDNGYVPLASSPIAAASTTTTEVPEVVGKIEAQSKT
jgi:hypothetical protein